MAKRKQPNSKVSSKEIAAVTRKLEAWGATLPESERAALQVLTARAPLVTHVPVSLTQARPQLTEAIQKVFVDLTKGTAGAWVKDGGPMWVKSGKVAGGEEVEITGKVIVKTQTR